MNTPSTPAPRISSPEAKALHDFAKEMLACSWDGADADGSFIQETAERLGLLRSVPYDATRHAGTEAREGDTVYELVPLSSLTPSSPAGGTEAWRAALEEARDYIIGLGQSPEAEGWPRDQYAVLAQIETALASPVPPPLPGEAVEWQFWSKNCRWTRCSDEQEARIWEKEGRSIRALYATPPARALPGITEREIADAVHRVQLKWLNGDNDDIIIGALLRALPSVSALDAGAALVEVFRAIELYARSDEFPSTFPTWPLEAASISRPAEREKWRTMESAPKDGTRILLVWGPGGGLSEHVELGRWRSDKGWCNTYGHPFNAEPDAWAPLAPFPSTDHVGGGE